MMAKGKKLYLGLVVLFMYAPIAVLIAQSFNASRYRIGISPYLRTRTS